MSVAGHVVISITIGSLLYLCSWSLAGLAVFLVTGILLDIDHYIDYLREYGISFNVKKVHETLKDCMNFKKMILILHSYEILFLLAVTIFTFRLGVLWKYAAIGLGIHLMLDQLTNTSLPFTYFLLYRIINNFETKKIFLNREVSHADWN